MFLSTLRQHCLSFLHIRGGNVKRNPLSFPSRQKFSEFKRSVLFTKNVAWCGLVPRSESGATVRRLHLPLRCLKSCSAACVPLFESICDHVFSFLQLIRALPAAPPSGGVPNPPQRFYSYQMNVEHSQHSIPLLLDN